MAYRDDRDALRDRVDALEAELGEARRRLADAEDAEALRAELASVQEELARARAEASGAPASRMGLEAARRAQLAVPIGVLSVVLVGSSAALLRPAASHAPPPPLGLAAPIATAVSPGPLLAPPAPGPGREVTALWTGKVSAGTAAIPAGTPCEIEARLAGADRAIRVVTAAVRCGARPLYAAVPGAGGARAAVFEEPGPEDGAFRRSLHLEDKASSVSIDTATGVAALRTPGVRIDLDEGPHRAEALVDAHAFAKPAFRVPILRDARVVVVQGDAPVAAGEACTVAVRPGWDGECRATVRCGERFLHGGPAPGLARCEARGARVSDALATERDGDPALEIADGHSVVIREAGAGDYVVTLALAPLR